MAYRPVKHDRFNGLARFTQLFDRGPNTLGSSKPFDRRMSVFSVETALQITGRVEWLAKGAMRSQEESVAGLPPIDTDMYLAIQRVNFTVWKSYDLGAEFRILSQRQTDDRRQGWLFEISREIMRHMRVGAGYNFTNFSDNEFSQNDYSVQGWFLRVQGMY